MNNFDRALESIRKDVPPTGEAADRVRGKLEQAAREGSLCAAFRADFDAYRAGALTDAKRMLLEDHLHTCAVCRREYAGVETAKVIEMPRRVWTRRWAIAAVAALLTVGVGLAAPSVLNVMLTPSGPRATVASIDGTLLAISSEGERALATGASIDEGQQIRTGKESHAMLRLRDGSLVEMAERSELRIEEKWRSKTIHLERGNVIVEAAKQRDGRLEVATADALVTVHGTIFGVSAALRGSRVSVVEGEVQVEETGVGQSILHRGDQKTTNAMERTAVADDISWSQNAAKYIALLEDLREVGQQISSLPMPGLRYSSRLIDHVPVDAVVVSAMPNLTSMIDEAQRIFDDKAKQSPAMAEWWATSGARGMRDAMDRARALGSFFGEEVIAAIPYNGFPIILAEVRAGAEADLRAELMKQGFNGPVSFDGSIVAIGLSVVPPAGPFTSTTFGATLNAKYTTGVGVLTAANVERISAGHVNSDIPPSPIGFENLRTVIAEYKGSLRDPVQTAEFAFNGARKGLASWLTQPGPMGSLEFFSRDATFAGAALTRDPREFLTEIMKVNGAQTNPIDEFWNKAGVDFVNDVAGSLGGEVAFALDGPLLPAPAWKLVIEVENADRLQHAIEQIAAVMEQQIPGSASVTHEEVEGRTYYALKGSGPMTIHYTFIDGYWLMGANRALLMQAIQDRAAALTLPRSPEFRAQLPADGPAFFSGLFYYNMGSMIGPLADQLKAAGALTPELQSKVDALTSNRAPGLVYVYADPDRIKAGSRSNLFQIALQSLATGNLLVPMSVASGVGTQQ